MTPENVIQIVWSAWWISWLIAAAWSDRAVKRPPTRHQIVYRVLAGLGAVLLFGGYRHDVRVEIILWRTPIALAWIMAAVVVVGLAFTWWARIHLGRLWSSSVTRKADHHVVDTGPYGIVRHPIYTGIILASIATAAMRGTAVAWLGAAVMTTGWVIKARLEEQFLREQLGPEQYGQYARRVPMLVPFLRSRGRPVGLLLLFISAILLSSCGLCGNDEVRRVASADGILEAVLFQRDCGATTDFSTQISIVLAHTELPNSGGNAYFANRDSGRAPAAKWGGPPADVRWLGPRVVEVRYHPASQVYFKPGAVTVRTG